jgi:hypothetical protein
MPTFTNMPRAQGLWDEQDVNLYNQYPFFIAANQYTRIQQWMVWDKLTGEVPWERNMGLMIKGVNAEPTPVVRQFPAPNVINSLPMKDVMSVRERTETEFLYGQNFESPLIHWLPSFKDWRQNQMDFAIKDINEKIQIFADQVYRMHIWSKSPTTYVCGASPEAVTSPMGLCLADCATQPDPGPGSKNVDWVTAQVLTMPGTAAGTLTLRQVKKALSIFTEDIDVPPFEGASNMPKDGMGLPGKYCLITSLGATSFWVDDEYLHQMKSLDLDTPHDGFTGDLFGNVRIKYERWPIRFTFDRVNNKYKCPPPQTYEANPNAVNFGQTIPNPEYVSAEIEVAWLVGAEGYRTIRIGPPPKEFSTGRLSQAKFNAMNWNAECRVTDNVLRQCLDAAGNIVLDTNKYGELLQIISDVKFGILPSNRRHVMPIIHRRARIDTSKG